MIRRLTSADFEAAVPGLAAVLRDAVEGGASVGFLAPLGTSEAADWWHRQGAGVRDGSLLVWIATDDAGTVLGTVSLALPAKPNSRHRAELVKLMVHRSARGDGLGRRLLATAESAARERGLTLLMLDTETGSAADQLYRATGWQRYGIVPDYAADPGGTLRDCSFYSKQLSTS